MHSVCVVPDEPINELAIEQLGCRKERGVIVDKFFLNRAIESLAVSVHLGRLWIRVVVGHVQTPEFCVKMLHKLTAVVCQNESYWKWKHLET